MQPNEIGKSTIIEAYIFARENIISHLSRMRTDFTALTFGYRNQFLVDVWKAHTPLNHHIKGRSMLTYSNERKFHGLKLDIPGLSKSDEKYAFSSSGVMLLCSVKHSSGSGSGVRLMLTSSLEVHTNGPTIGCGQNIKTEQCYPTTKNFDSGVKGLLSNYTQFRKKVGSDNTLLGHVVARSDLVVNSILLEHGDCHTAKSI